MFPMEETVGQTVSHAAFRKNVSGLSNIIPLQGYSPRDFIGWRRMIDLLFDNGVRANPILHQNLTFWARLVRPGGILCGHGHCDEFPDVKSEVVQLAAGCGAEADIAGTLWSLRACTRSGSRGPEKL